MGVNRKFNRKAKKNDYKRQQEFLSNKSENERRFILLINSEIEVISEITKEEDRILIFERGQKYFKAKEEDGNESYPPEFHNLIKLLSTTTKEQEVEIKTKE